MASIQFLILFLSCTSIFSEFHEPSIPEIVVDQIVIEDNWSWVNASEVLLDGDNEYITKTANGYSIYSDCLGVSFKCTASYPVYWTVDKVEELDTMFAYALDTHTFRNVSIEQPTKSPSYEAILKFWVDGQGLTRNYTCRSTNQKDEHLQTSIFLFVQGPLQNYLVNAGKTFEIGIDEKELLEIPCGVSTENVEVTLLKEEILFSHPFNVSIWNKLSTNSSITFDPRRGFSFKVADLMDILGLYKCTIDENTDDVVHFNIDMLSPLPDPDQESFNLRSILQGSAKLEYDYIHDTVVCCSNSDKKPTMQLMSCANPAECEIFKHIILSKRFNEKDPYGYNLMYYNQEESLTSNCTRGYVFYPTFWVRCNGDGIDALSQFYYSFNSTDKHELVEHPISNYGLPSVFKIVSVTESVPLDSLMLITNDRDDDSHHDRHHGISASDVDKMMYSGQKLQFRCYYSSYMFSEGTYFWEIVWENGTKKRYSGTSDHYMKGLVTVDVILSDTIVSIGCHAGVWNSSDWSSKYINLTVQAPVAPQIDGPEVTEIYLVINGTDKTLECTFSGKPFPEISWEKDGKILRVTNSNEIERHNNTSVLKIAKITHESSGEYSCRGQSLGGTAVKTFIVFVEEEGGVHDLIITAVVLTFLIVGGYLIFVLWKTQFQRKVLQHMTSSTFQNSA